MTFSHATFWARVEAILGERDLLCHPFYKAWSAGELTRGDLRRYAAEYYHHVAAFPTYLSRLHTRLAPGALRTAVAANLADEEYPRPHWELWIDFLLGMSGKSQAVERVPSPEVRDLIGYFRQISGQGPIGAALAAFYAYESQVPRIAAEKARGLRELYGADARTCSYFTLHQTADMHHSHVWRQQIDAYLAQHPHEAHTALAAVDRATALLWAVLDGMECVRQQRAHAAVQ